VQRIKVPGEPNRGSRCTESRFQFYGGGERRFIAGCSQAEEKGRKEEWVGAALLSSTHWSRTRWALTKEGRERRGKRNRKKVGKESLYSPVSTTKTM